MQETGKQILMNKLETTPDAQILCTNRELNDSFLPLNNSKNLYFYSSKNINELIFLYRWKEVFLIPPPSCQICSGQIVTAFRPPHLG